MYYIAISINNIITYKYVSHNELQSLMQDNVQFNHVFNNGLLYFKGVI